MECKCNKEREIATMQAEIKTLFKKADSLSDITSSLHSLDKSQSMMAQLVSNMADHDRNQDEKQDAVNMQITETLSNVNENLSELNEGQRQLNNKVAVLEERVDENEALHNIDMRVLKQKHYKEVLSRYVLPTGGAVVIIMQLIQFFLDK